MAGHSSLRLIAVVALCFFSCLISMNSAVPITRTRSLMMMMMQEPQDFRRFLLGNSWRGSKMLIELADYPGSGANNRHTPKPQLGRGCVDC